MTEARTAMVLAAGLGERMRPLTLRMPKPLVPLAGKPLIDHVLDKLAAVGVTTAIVNVHYLPEQLEAHLAARRGGPPETLVSDERGVLLDTGGGVKKALPLLGTEPFFHINSDSLWSERRASNISAMAAAWDAGRMDMLLLLAERQISVGFDGAGDFFRDEAGRLARRDGAASAPYVYAGVAIIKPELFADTPDGPFSLNLLFDRCIAKGTLFGHLLDGRWLHVGTPETIGEAELSIADSAA